MCTPAPAVARPVPRGVFPAAAHVAGRTPCWQRVLEHAPRPFALAAFTLSLLAAVPPASAAVTATLVGGSLQVAGSDADDTITLRLVSGDATRLDVLDGATSVGTFARSAFTTILVTAGPGNDTITMDESNGAFTDTETPTLDGGSGQDTISGGIGAETILGGDGHDTLTPRRGNDVVLGGPGDDTVVWNPGDGSDVIEGEGGTDTLTFNGANVNEVFTVAPNGQRVTFTRNVGNIVMDLGTVERLTVTALGGNDSFTAGTGLAALIAITFDGGDGVDTITGGDGGDTLLGGADNDTVIGGDGNDVITGGPGVDTVVGGDGDDRLVWNDGDGTDVVEGGVGTDTAEVNGSTGATGDVFTIVPNGVRARLDRTNLVPFVLDIGTTETLVVNGLGGNDSITGANGLSTVIALRLDGGEGDDTLTGGDGADTLLGGPGSDTLTGGPGADVEFGGPGNDTFVWSPGSGSDTLDGEDGADTLVFNGSNAAEAVAASANGQRVRLTRDVAAIVMDVGTTEQIVITALGGNDTFTGGAGLSSVAISYDGGDGNDTITGGDGADTLSGGLGEDTITGGDGPDTLAGGAGNDTIDGGGGNDSLTGGQGNDVLLGGPGDDTFTWNPGDASDTVEGGAGTDTLAFNGSNIAEVMTAAANGQRVTFTRNIAAITMDLGTTERLVVSSLGGNDTFTGGVGLAPLIAITVDAGEGDDVLTGGDGPDVLLGGAGLDTISGNGGDDTLTGGPGGDTVSGGPGNDRVVWNDGDGTDLVEGGPGSDTVEINGSNAAGDVLTVTPNGPRVKIDRTNLVAFSLDVGTTESVLINGLAGADTVIAVAGIGALVAVTVDGGVGADVVLTSASNLVTFAGGADGDTLTFDAQSQPVTRLPASLLVTGQPRATFTAVETVNLTNTASALPAIAVTSPPVTATAPFLKVTGTASDDVGIASVVWATDRGGRGTAAGTASWTAADIPLQGGANVVSVTVTDSSGNTVTTTFDVAVAAFTYYLAEGATGAFFDLDISVANPNPVPAPITLTFLKEDGTTVTKDYTVAATAQLPIRVDDIPGLEQTAVSTIVTSTSALPLVVERTMQWDAQHYGSHGGTAVDGPRTRWVFAEGSQGFFDTYVLLANASATAADVTVTFLRESGPPVVTSVAVGPTSRVNVATSAIPSLAGTSFSIVVDSTAPIIAERAMYFGTARFWDGGHESAGVAEGATSWFLAEGATGPFFDTYILVGNPNAAAANVTLTFLTDRGATVTRNVVLGGNQRLTVNVEDQDPLLADAGVATTVSADAPVVVERAMYWPGSFAQWYEAHNSFGVTALSTKWGLSEGRVGLAEGFETYILLANPSTTTAAQVSVEFLRASGIPVVKTFTVPAASRFNVHVNSMVTELANETFGATITVTNGVGIAVERAMYSNALGQTWGAGTNAPATRLP